MFKNIIAFAVAANLLTLVSGEWVGKSLKYTDERKEIAESITKEKPLTLEEMKAKLSRSMNKKPLSIHFKEIKCSEKYVPKKDEDGKCYAARAEALSESTTGEGSNKSFSCLYNTDAESSDLKSLAFVLAQTPDDFEIIEPEKITKLRTYFHEKPSCKPALLSMKKFDVEVKGGQSWGFSKSLGKGAKKLTFPDSVEDLLGDSDLPIKINEAHKRRWKNFKNKSKKKKFKAIKGDYKCIPHIFTIGFLCDAKNMSFQYSTDELRLVKSEQIITKHKFTLPMGGTKNWVDSMFKVVYSCILEE